MSTIYWKDFDNEFRKSNDGDVKVMTNIDAIHNSLRNIFETFQGSRRMLPDFALPVYGVLFEPVDEVTSYRLGEMILAAIERWETRIVIDNVDIKAQPDKNQYTINLEYRIINDSREDSALVFTNVLRAA